MCITPWVLLSTSPNLGWGAVEGKRKVVILITGNRGGYLQPCGCNANQFDYGLAVEAANLQAERKKFEDQGKIVILLDSGNFASKLPDVTETTVRAFAKMAYAAVHITTQDRGASNSVEGLLHAKGIPVVESEPLHQVNAGATTDKGSALPIGLGVWKSWPDILTSKSQLASIKFSEKVVSAPEAGTRLYDGHPSLIVGPYSGPQRADVWGNVLYVSAPPKEVFLECELDEAAGRFKFLREVPVRDIGVRDETVDTVVQQHFATAMASKEGLRSTKEPANIPFKLAAKCESCHHKEFASWQLSRHASAIKSLEAKNRLIPDCLPCHVATYQPESHFDPASSESRESVTCASCHGPAIVHSVTQKPTDVIKTPSIITCQKCHTKDTSPGFVYANSIKKTFH